MDFSIAWYFEDNAAFQKMELLQSSNEDEGNSCWLLYYGFLLGLIINTEYGSDIFFRNVS
jgi:hypothetical protein